MSDPSIRLKTLFGNALPSEKDFDHEIVKPVIVGSIHQFLRQYRVCVIVGRPRSGKTTLAQYVGWQVYQGHLGSLEDVRYLDCANIADSETQFPYIPTACLHRNWLIIIDNWHARPECQHRLWRLLTDQRDARFSVIICLTTFTSDDSASNIPDLSAFGPESPPTVDTSVSSLEVAKEMIARRYRAHFNAAEWRPSPLPLSGAHTGPHEFAPDSEDFAQALTAPSSHKKIRGNLRFLHWRLAAWDPAKHFFRDVQVDDVLATIRNNMITPLRAQLATLDRVAAVSQWELPYSLPYGADPPPGLTELELRNIVVPVDTGRSWRMDSTDAYLFLYARYQGEWPRATEELMAQYVEGRPDTVYAILNTIMAQARPDPMTHLISALLSSAPSREAVRNVLASGMASGTIGPNKMFRIIYALARSTSDDGDDADQRLPILNDILAESLGRSFGISVCERGIYITMWLLIFLARDPESFGVFMRAFLLGYGHSNLSDKIASLQSGRSQRNMLRLLARFDSDLSKRLHENIVLKPDKKKGTEFSELESLVNGLYLGTLHTHDKRLESITTLRSIDASFLLETINDCKRPANTLQQLIQAASWLAPEESRRLAGLLPSLLPKCDTTGNATSWSHLINNVYSVSQEIAEDMVDVVRAYPIGTYLSGSFFPFGRLLGVMEKVQPGSVAAWVAADESSLRDALTDKRLAKSELLSHIEDILLPLAAFAAPSLVRICDEHIREALVSATTPSHGLGNYTVRGALHMAGVTARTYGGGLDRDSYGRDTASIQLLVALFELNREFCDGKPCNYLDVCTHISELPAPAILGIAQLPHRWLGDDVGMAARKILRGNSPERTRALEMIVLGVHLLGKLEWIENKYDIRQFYHRGLMAAIHERMLLVSKNHSTATCTGRLNLEHPFVRNTVYCIDNVLDAAGIEQGSLAEWMISIRNAMPVMEIDTWRSRLITFRAVDTIASAEGGQLSFRFRKGRAERDRIYGVLGL